MTEHVRAPDGTRIAYDRVGAGQPLVLVGGAGQFRAVDPDTRELTAELACRGFDVVHQTARAGATAVASRPSAWPARSPPSGP